MQACIEFGGIKLFFQNRSDLISGRNWGSNGGKISHLRGNNELVAGLTDGKPGLGRPDCPERDL